MNSPSDRSVRDTRVEYLFCQAKGLPPAQQETFLDDHCEGHEQLREVVEQLLSAFREAPLGEFRHPILPQNAMIRGLEATAQTETNSGEPLEAGANVGRYKILQQIGEGGMGAVYMAEQSRPVSRRVALKIIKPGMDSKAVIARFEAERQAIAMMDHPNIAKVLDAGETQTGRPFFAMELIHGIPLTKYCDQQRLSVQERMRLFIPVAEAVAHAHQKGIIHRDLKPSNILVAEYDQRPVPKIIDFGIAKAVGERLTEKTLFTLFGQLVGTIEYMSPEQSKLNQLDIDTRSDIYSLGVILYELMVGTTPFDTNRLQSAAFDEMLRIVREEDPPTPSSRVTTSADGASLAWTRQSNPKMLSRLLSGDIDWIVMTCLEKDRSRRYDTASGLVEDLQRHLNNEGVNTRPPTWSYRLRKAIRRNKVLYAASAAILASLVLGTYASTVQAIRANREAARATSAKAEESRARRDAERERDRALRTIYAAEMSRAKRALDSQMYGEAKKIVEKYRHPEMMGFCGWEWRYLWQQTRSDELAIVGRHDYIVDHVKFSSDGRYLVSAGQDQRVTIWNVDRRSRVAEMRYPDAIAALDVSRNGEIVTKCENEDFLRFSLLPDRNRSGQSSLDVPLDEGMSAINSATYSGDGRWLALLGERKLQLWDASTKEVRREVAVDGGRRLAFSNDNSILAVAMKNRKVVLLDSMSLVTSSTLSFPGSVWATFKDLGGNLEFSLNGEWLAFAGGETAKGLTVWSLKDGQAFTLSEGKQFGSDWVGHVGFSRDGSRLISVANDRKVTL